MVLDYTGLASLRVAITLPLQCIFQLNAFDDEFQFGPVQRLLVAGESVVVEAALLQSLGPNTVPTAIKIQNFYLGLATIDKDKDRATQGIFTHQVLGHCRQAVERSAHIGGLGIEPDPDLGLREKH